MGLKFNHVCLVAGVLLLVLAFTVFAKATAINFGCTNPFICSVKDYCQGVPGAVPAMLVSYGECSYYIDADPPQPCTYYFSSPTAGRHICTLTIQTTAYGNTDNNPLQNNEVTRVSINGQVVATTVDRYANTGDPLGTTFCGTDTQTFSGINVMLQANNSINFNAEASHGIVSARVDCYLVGRDCSQAQPPIIQELPNKTIKYNDAFGLDLWDYISSFDSLLDLNTTVSVTGNSVSCTLDQNRFLSCRGTKNLGVSAIQITVTDLCNKTSTKTFTVTTTNSPPALNVPDFEKSCADDLNKLVDLTKYDWDENEAGLTYSFVSQSNPTLADCNLVSGKYISCKVKACSDSCTNLTVSTTDELGVTGNDTFKVCFKNKSPEWKSIPSQCINSSKTKFIDLRNYAYDTEDKNNLTYSITNQSNSQAVNCSIADSNYISCALNTNRHLSNTLTIRAADSRGAYSETQTTISTNCFDQNGNDTNGNGEVYFESKQTGICLEKCTSYSTQLKLTNNSTERKCFKFDAESFPYNMLKVSVTPDNYCLNSGESSFLTLSANTCGAEQRPYTVKVSATRVEEINDGWSFEPVQSFIDTSLSVTLNFEVGTCNSFDGFRIVEFDGKVCKGEKKDLTVLVRNTSSSQKRIYLSADNSMVLPYFDRQYITLNAGEEKPVQLTINALSLSEGYQYISLSGDAENYHIEKRLEAEIVDCSSIAKRTFTLSVPSVCFDVKKGQLFESQFTISRLAGECGDCCRNPKDFFVNVSGMPAELSYNKVSLSAGESKAITYTIRVPDTTPAGHQLVTVSASDGTEWNSFTDQKSVCLNVLGEQHAGLSVITQAKDIAWCGTQVFEIELKNTGDLDANYSLFYTELPRGVSVSFSEDRVFLKKGESKIIYAAVSTNINAQPGDNQKLKVIVRGPVELSAWIYFNIKEKTTLSDLEIVSATKQVNMKGNSISSYEIVLRNNSGKTMKDVFISFENVPKDVNIDSSRINELLPGKTVNVSGKIVAGDTNGWFESMFVVSSGSAIDKKGFALNIAYNPKQGGISGAGFFGLFSFGGVNFSELTLRGVFLSVFLAIFLIVIVAVIVLGLVYLVKPRKREVWAND